MVMEDYITLKKETGRHNDRIEKNKVRTRYWKNNDEFGFGYVNFKVTAGHLGEEN